MSSDPLAHETSENGAHNNEPAPEHDNVNGGASDKGSLDRTPRSEVPPSFNVMTPGTSDAMANNTSNTKLLPQNDYFTPRPNPTPTSLPTHDIHPRPAHSPAPVTSASDATAAGHILPADSLSSLHSSDRPPPHTTLSSLSIESSTSSATVTPLHPRPRFPNQALSALHTQDYTGTTHRPYFNRRGTAQPANVSTFASAIASLHSGGIRTANNSPTVTPGNGLFHSTGPPSAPAAESVDGSGMYASPFLHFTHQHIPKETHIADVDVDPVSGRKLINHYEIIDELGRGTHGKVKLGRDLESPASNPTYVAIKIVERFSKRRKLGRLGTTEDKVKKEVAILKKARHPNIVALLEVIDDPNRKKVYIVLEWVERGEIRWRVKGPKEIAMIEARRYEREKKGPHDDRALAEDLAVLSEAQRRLTKHKRRQIKEHRLRKRDALDAPEHWSNEISGDTDSEESEEDRLSRISSLTAHSDAGKLTVDAIARRPSRTPSPLHFPDVHGSTFLSLTSEPETTSPIATDPERRRASSAFSMTGLEGTMYGPYDPLTTQTSRVASLNSLTSSRGSGETFARRVHESLDAHLDSELEYVPIMTMDQIRVAFRDTLLGLQYLHYQGIVHRDIKPPNLLASIENRVKISDFGVSYLGRPTREGEAGEDVSEADAYDLDDEAKELAKTVGTPAFYAPELCITDPSDMPLPVTKAIDVWALGITLFCMLFARTPFVDSEFVVMRQIADEEIYLPRKRLQPVDNRPKSRPTSHGRAFPPLQTGRRHEMELVYEDISDELHDLLRRLLIKDPRKRITLEEVRHHPWVIEDIPNKLQWLEETDTNRQAEGKKIEVSKEELNTAVVPLNLVERMRSGIKKVLDRTGITRNRGQSNATAHKDQKDAASPAPTATSSASNGSQDYRRKSVRGDESIFTALKASRDGEHPLSKNLATSSNTVERYIHPTSSSSGDVEGLNGLHRTTSRPDPPTRAMTVTSAAGSMRTVKQSDYRRGIPGHSPPPSPGLSEAPSSQASPGRLSGLLGGTSNLMKTVRERSTQRSKNPRGQSGDRGSVDSGDAHGAATIGLSQATAAGHVHAPDSLREQTPNSSTHNSPLSSRPHSAMSENQQGQSHLQPGQGEPGTLSRMSSSSSLASASRRVGSLFRNLSREHYRKAPESSIDEWKRVDEERVRKLVRESQDEEEKGRSSPSNYLVDSPEPFEGKACPPSPDDLRAKQPNSRVPSLTASSNPDTPPDSISPTNRTGSLPPALVSSSSDLGSAVSMSVSNPSIPSVISEASSVDLNDGYEYFGEDKREQSSDDTLNPAESDMQGDEGYTPDHEAALDSDQDDDFDDSSDSDGGLVMRRKSAIKPSGHGLTVSADTSKERRGTGLSMRSKKSSRSGSNNTMKKIRTRESGDERLSPEISEE